MPWIDSVAAAAVFDTDGRALARACHWPSFDEAEGPMPSPVEPLTYGMTDRSAQPKLSPQNHGPSPSCRSSHA
jgi:hypothetical protein